MQQVFKELKVLFPDNCDFDILSKTPPKRPFDEDVCLFLNELSSAIMKDKEAKRYSDIVTFGFFCRKANIEKLKQKYYKKDRIGRGFCFHIAPSNVPINFAYSIVASLLAGNVSVVRVSSKNFEQTKIICRLLNYVNQKLGTFLENYVSIIQYAHNKQLTDYFSSISDVRIIWGGDDTVNNIKSSNSSSRCVDITFADRYSLCVLNAEYVIKICDWDKVAQDFYNDTYLYDQNACSSPRLIYWIGKKEVVKKAKEIFWSNIIKRIYPKYKIEPVVVVDKLSMDYKAAIELDNVKVKKNNNNIVDRIELNKLPLNIVDYMCPGGSFIEYSDENLNELKKIVNTKFQTLSYLGLNSQELANWVINNGLKGIDRIVPIGKTTEFNLIWDGYDLIDMMTRKLNYF